MGFIEDYTKLMADHIPTNKHWLESVAVNVFNTTLGTSVRADTKLGRLNTNLFFMCIGPSGIAHKTIPLKYFAIPTLIQYSQRIEEHINKGVTDKKLWTKVRPIMPSRFSVEGMIEYLAKEQSQGVIIRDEFSSLFKERSKSYIADILEFLSELYDGVIQKRYTRSYKLEEPKDVCVNLLGATTPYIYNIMDLSFFVQGTGNRILYDIAKVEKPEPTPRDFFWQEDTSTVDDEAKPFIDRLVQFKKTLMKVTEHEPIYSAILPREKLAKFRDKTIVATMRYYEKDPQGIKHTYVARMAEMCIKLSVIHSMSRQESTDGLKKMHEAGVTLLPVIDDDVDWAINKIVRHIKNFFELKRQWSLMGVRKPVMTDEAYFDRIIAILKEQPNKECMHTKLWKYSGWTLPKFNEVMRTMLLQKTVRSYTKEDYKSKGGRKPLFYRLPKPEELKNNAENRKVAS